MFIIAATLMMKPPMVSTLNGEGGRVVYSVYMPGVFGGPPGPLYDMVRFMSVSGAKGPLYEVRHSSGSQARHQTQVENSRFYHTKGNEIKAEWEELWSANGFIYRGTDTSPGDGKFYTLYPNSQPGVPAGSAWSPRFWRVGDIFRRDPFVVFYSKSNCGVITSGVQVTWLRFEAFYPAYTFKHNVSGLEDITLNNVVELSWLLHLDDTQPEESYFYAESYGLVAWRSKGQGNSAISEIHKPHARPDNKREIISCLHRAVDGLQPGFPLNPGPLPPEYRAK